MLVTTTQPILQVLGKLASKFTLVTPNYSILFMVNIMGHNINDGTNTKNIININMDTLHIPTHII